MSTPSRKICGIYLVTNLVTGMQYVGRSTNCKQRWILHRYEARSKRRELTALCKAIAQFGEASFKFEIFKELPEELLKGAERAAMEHFDCVWPKGYNVGSEGGGSTAGALLREERMREKRMSDSTYDARYRKVRAKAAATRIAKEKSNPEWALSCRKKAVRTFRRRMKNPEYRAMISAQRARAAAASHKVRYGDPHAAVS